MKHGIIYLQEHRFLYEDLATKDEQMFRNSRLVTSSTWKNSVNAVNGGVGMLLSPQAYNALANVEMITSRLMVATLNGIPQTTVVSY